MGLLFTWGSYGTGFKLELLFCRSSFWFQTKPVPETINEVLYCMFPLEWFGTGLVELKSEMAPCKQKLIQPSLVRNNLFL